MSILYVILNITTAIGIQLIVNGAQNHDIQRIYARHGDYSDGIEYVGAFILIASVASILGLILSNAISGDVFLLAILTAFMNIFFSMHFCFSGVAEQDACSDRKYEYTEYAKTNTSIFLGVLLMLFSIVNFYLLTAN